MRGGTGCVVKYVPHSNQTSCVGSQFATEGLDWVSGVLAMDGVIYCIPTDAKRILAINPIGEFLATTKATVQENRRNLDHSFRQLRQMRILYYPP